MAKKKRTGLLVATGCGLLLCIPVCLGAIGGLGGGVWFYMASDHLAAEFDEVAMTLEDAQSDTIKKESDALVDQDGPGAMDDEAADSGLDLEEMDADFDSGLFDDEADEDDGARVVIDDEDDGVATVTNTRRRSQPTPQDDNDDDRDVMADLAALDDMEFEDEEDFDDIAAEIAALDSLDDLDDQGCPRAAPWTSIVTDAPSGHIAATAASSACAKSGVFIMPCEITLLSPPPPPLP